MDTVLRSRSETVAIGAGQPFCISALVNSVTAEDDRLEVILRKIVSAAGDYGIAPEDVIIDPLAMAVEADNDAVTTTLRTTSLIRDGLGVNMSLGASNVSIGLPRRHVLNAAFLPMAMAAGQTSAIMSSAEVGVQSVRGADLLLGHDPWGACWIAAHRAQQAVERKVAAAS